MGLEVLRLLPDEKNVLADHSDVSLRHLILRQGILSCGELSLPEAAYLVGLVRQTDPSRPIIEIGTLFGRSSVLIACGKSPEQVLVTVDNYSWNPYDMPPWFQRETAAKQLQDAVKTLGVRVVAMDKAEFYATYDGARPSLVFLDAIHSYEETLKDIRWAKGVGADTICGHDFDAAHPGVRQAVDEAGGARDVVESLWVLAAGT